MASSWPWNGVFGGVLAPSWPWNGVLDNLMAPSWPWNGVLGALGRQMGPGTTFEVALAVGASPAAPSALAEILYRCMYVCTSLLT